MFNPKNDLTLWDEYKHHKAVAQKASLQFSMEDISLLATGLRSPLNIPSQNPQRQTFQTGKCRVSFISVKWMHISESSFLERIFLGFISGEFSLCPSLQCSMKYHIIGFTGKVLKHCLMRKDVYLPEWNARITKQFLWKLLSNFYMKRFLFSP